MCNSNFDTNVIPEEAIEFLGDKNQKIPKDILEWLAFHPNFRIRLGIVIYRFEEISPRIKKKLTKDKDQSVSDFATQKLTQNDMTNINE